MHYYRSNGFSFTWEWCAAMFLIYILGFITREYPKMLEKPQIFCWREVFNGECVCLLFCTVHWVSLRNKVFLSWNIAGNLCVPVEKTILLDPQTLWEISFSGTEEKSNLTIKQMGVQRAGGWRGTWLERTRSGKIENWWYIHHCPPGLLCAWKFLSVAKRDLETNQGFWQRPLLPVIFYPLKQNKTAFG